MSSPAGTQSVSTKRPLQDGSEEQPTELSYYRLPTRAREAKTEQRIASLYSERVSSIIETKKKEYLLFAQFEREVMTDEHRASMIGLDDFMPRMTSYIEDMTQNNPDLLNRLRELYSTQEFSADEYRQVLCYADDKHYNFPLPYQLDNIEIMNGTNWSEKKEILDSSGASIELTFSCVDGEVTVTDKHGSPVSSIGARKLLTPSTYKKDGTIECHAFGGLHSKYDMPSTIEGKKLSWHRHGNRHRYNGPAVIKENGTVVYYVEGRKVKTFTDGTSREAVQFRLDYTIFWIHRMEHYILETVANLFFEARPGITSTFDLASNPDYDKLTAQGEQENTIKSIRYVFNEAIREVYDMPLFQSLVEHANPTPLNSDVVEGVKSGKYNNLVEGYRDVTCSFFDYVKSKFESKYGDFYKTKSNEVRPMLVLCPEQGVIWVHIAGNYISVDFARPHVTKPFVLITNITFISENGHFASIRTSPYSNLPWSYFRTLRSKEDGSYVKPTLITANYIVFHNDFGEPDKKDGPFIIRNDNSAEFFTINVSILKVKDIISDEGISASRKWTAFFPYYQTLKRVRTSIQSARDAESARDDESTMSTRQLLEEMMLEIKPGSKTVTM